MANDEQIISALTRRFRQKLADTTLSLATVKTYADQALAALVSGTTVINVTFADGGTGAEVNCNPALLLDACTAIIEEEAEANTDHGTGATHIDMGRNPVAT